MRGKQRKRLWSLVGLAASATRVVAETTAPSTGDQIQKFEFGYGSSSLVLPVIETCPTPLSLSRLTATNAGGPDPVAPYTMIAFVHEQLMDGAGIQYERMYARSMNVGDMSSTRAISHPWMNGTQFIGCIWSSNGVSGGCQDLVTVVPSYTETAVAYANATSACRGSVMGSWVTETSKTLDVDVAGTSGTISPNAWPPSCSDIKFTPKNGTGPYTLVIAPASHPPVNITSSGSLNYTIRLTHGQAFMAGVFDSQGNSWAIGPLHAGTSSDVSCLSVLTGQTVSRPKEFDKITYSTSVVAAFLGGSIIAFLVTWFFRPKHKAMAESHEFLDPYADPRPATHREDSGSTVGYKSVSPYQPGYDTPRGSPQLYDPAPYPTPPRDSRTYSREPFDPRASVSSIPPDFQPSRSDQRNSFRSSMSRPQDSLGSSSQRVLHAVGGGPASPSIHSTHEEEERKARKVYVVHADGGGGDVHIQLPAGESNVIELPPGYRHQTPPRPCQSPGGDSLRSQRSGGVQSPYIQLAPSPSRGSGFSDMTEEEIRARAEAALAEKGRPLSAGRPPG